MVMVTVTVMVTEEQPMTVAWEVPASGPGQVQRSGSFKANSSCTAHTHPRTSEDRANNTGCDSR